MNDGYIFTCTPCGKPHAGECPPKAKVEKDLVAFVPFWGRRVTIPATLVEPPTTDEATEIEADLHRGQPGFTNVPITFTFSVDCAVAKIRDYMAALPDGPWHKPAFEEDPGS